MAKKEKSLIPEVSKQFISDIKSIIFDSRNSAARSVNFARVMMYWRVGERIYVEEQKGKERADYGTYLIKSLSAQILPELGNGFSERLLEQSRQFYRTYPIPNEVRSELNWSQYRALIQISDPDKREFYRLESINNAWSGAETERQIHSGLYERLLLSTDKKAVLAIARKERIPQKPAEIIKDPMVLEFLGLERKAKYYENDLETAIMDNLSKFLLELGKGFSFVSRQKRILLEDDEFFCDLVFYNRLLRCFVVIEIKTKRITHEDIGQLQMYVNYFDRVEKLSNENPTVGILLCAEKNDAAVKFTLPEGNKTILTSKYQLYLPTPEQLVNELKETIRECGEANDEHNRLMASADAATLI